MIQKYIDFLVRCCVLISLFPPVAVSDMRVLDVTVFSDAVDEECTPIDLKLSALADRTSMNNRYVVSLSLFGSNNDLILVTGMPVVHEGQDSVVSGCLPINSDFRIYLSIQSHPENTLSLCPDEIVISDLSEYIEQKGWQ
ncbi:hypothetical protein [Aliidiomarina celeris]|uniref:hypothetical protein n=1 Tax=Aliidiomarina celeris TaxID=2249428 RepID=UPI0013003EE2|nr:hypothetical protein [Aliidiomarina celeris]